MTERWEPIDGAYGYEVSDLGRVRSWHPRAVIRTGRELPVILKQTLSSGRPNVKFRDGKTRYVPKLVADAFLGERPLGLQLCHRDDDSTNNKTGNLYYGTPAENYRDRDNNGKTALGERHGRSKLTADFVRQIRELRARKVSLTAIAQKFSVSRPCVSSVISGETWGHVV